MKKPNSSEDTETPFIPVMLHDDAVFFFQKKTFEFVSFQWRHERYPWNHWQRFV